MTAMREALLAAGIESAEDKKRRWCTEAWAKYPGTNEGLERRNHVLREMDPATRMFFDEQTTALAIGKALNEVLKEIRDASRGAGTGRYRNDIQRIGARPTNAVKAAGGGHSSCDTHADNAPSADAGKPAGDRHSHSDIPSTVAVSTPSASTAEPQRERATLLATPIPFAPSPAITRRVTAIAAAAQAICSLDFVRIDGKPIRRMVVCDAREWAGVNGRKARFIDAITANMPGNWVIGDHCPDKLADELWQKTETENAA